MVDTHYASHRHARTSPVGKPESARAPTVSQKGIDMAPSGEFLTIAEVAGQMRVSKMTVYRLVHGGELPAVRVGRSFRVTQSAVDAFIERSFYEAG